MTKKLTPTTGITELTYTLLGQGREPLTFRGRLILAYHPPKHSIRLDLINVYDCEEIGVVMEGINSSYTYIYTGTPREICQQWDWDFVIQKLLTDAGYSLKEEETVFISREDEPATDQGAGGSE